MNIWRVYHVGSGRDYFYNYKPNDSDLTRLAEKEDHDAYREILEGERSKKDILQYEYSIEKIKVATK